MLKKLRIAIERTLIFAYDIFEYMRDVWAVHVKQRHRIVLRETKGQQPRPAQGSRVAIVALYPTNESLPFTKNLLRLLHGNGFFILAVSSRKLPDAMYISILSDCHHLIERMGVGRDFGSYKMGLAWIEKQNPGLNGIDTLVLANDSLFYPAAFNREFKMMLNKQRDWQCLFENYVFHYHAQSFFMLFRRPVFSSSAFQKFWRQYQPYSSRRHSINQGEVAFSVSLRRAGYSVSAQFDSTRITKDLQDPAQAIPLSLLAELCPAAKGWLIARDLIFNSSISIATTNSYTCPPASNPEIAQHIDKTVYTNLSQHALNLVSIENLRWAHLIGSQMEQTNPTHALALLANNLYAAPIKRDICYRGSYDIFQALNLSLHFTANEREAMARDINRRGTPAKLTGLTSVLWRAGRI